MDDTGDYLSAVKAAAERWLDERITNAGTDEPFEGIERDVVIALMTGFACQFAHDVLVGNAAGVGRNAAGGNTTH